MDQCYNTMALVNVFLRLDCRLALRYDMPFPFWTVVFGGIFENFHSPSCYVNFGPFSCQLLNMSTGFTDMTRGEVSHR